MREASSVNAGVVVRSTKRMKPSSTASSPSVIAGGVPSAGGGAGPLDGGPGAGAGLAVGDADGAGPPGVSRSSSGSRPSLSRSTRAHGLSIATRWIVTRRGQSASRPAMSTRLM